MEADYTVQQLADMLKIRPKRLRQSWRALGLPGYYVGQQIRFRAEGVREWRKRGGSQETPEASARRMAA